MTFELLKDIEPSLLSGVTFKTNLDGLVEVTRWAVTGGEILKETFLLSLPRAREMWANCIEDGYLRSA
jgi:hypothetical protein